MMHKLSFLLFSTFVVCSCTVSNELPMRNCPDSYLISPCTCEAFSNDFVQSLCHNLTSPEDLEAVFKRVPGWKIAALEIVNSTMLYIPCSIFNSLHIQEITIRDSTFASLYDKPPISNSLRYIGVVNSVFQRGILWNLFSQLNIKNLFVKNSRIRRLGRRFRDGISSSLLQLELFKTNISRISDDALSNLENLALLRIRMGLLKSIDNIVFPRSVFEIDFKDNRIEYLRDGIFDNLPKLGVVDLSNNLITTVGSGVFHQIIGLADIYLEGCPINCNCEIKWIVTAGFSTTKATCTAPKSLGGREIEKLTESDFHYCVK